MPDAERMILIQRMILEAIQRLLGPYSLNPVIPSQEAASSDGDHSEDSDDGRLSDLS